MDRERHKPTGQQRGQQRGQRRARRSARPAVEPVIMAARRPGFVKREVLPREVRVRSSEPPTAPIEPTESNSPPVRRAARIVAAPSRDGDAQLRERERLLARLLASEGRSSITRAADDYVRAGFDFPVDQRVQLQLLEHLDETLARASLGALAEILAREPPLKRPIFEQRLRRLEDSAEEEATRKAAADLRRQLRA